ncbi:glycosyltransferase [Fulvivirga ulvae]|uniref:glycosyltransferase n=1 Tax=Fulvivirga ulvae TaxID=2904245 RepID=UPI001F2E4412|nr:glycosyltransferase [Fulvivirga ulvae]UII30188.1 glycosyltransferase [Fulvivirga ulvae]
MITYYWPPAGGISVLRSLKIVKYLRDFGWEPIVFTHQNPQYPLIDHSNFKDIPDDVTVLKKGAIEPFELFKKITGRRKDDSLQNILYIGDKKQSWSEKLAIWLRGNFFIPDARALWIGPSVRYLTKYLKENPVDAIFSDGPPHTNTLIACRVSKITNIPWLADFQDPWTQVDYYKDFMISKWADRWHKKLEQECFRQSDKITIVTESWKRDLESIGANNVSVIPWGYDEEDYVGIERKLSEKFTISHTGILGVDRISEPLFKALSDLCDEVPGFRDNLQVKLIGAVDYHLQEIVNSYGLDGAVEIMKHIPRKQVLSEIFNSQVLLLLINKSHNAKGRMPAKLFEYLRAARPILCLGDTDSDCSKILSTTNSGVTYGYDDYNGLKKALKDYYTRFLQRELEIDQKNIGDFSIRKLTGTIAGYLEEISRREND